MQHKKVLTFAALSATFLLPMAGALAQDDSNAAPNPPAAADSATTPDTPGAASTTTTTESTSTTTNGNNGASATVTEHTTTTTSTEGAGTIMDASLFRTSLHDLRGLLMEMRENRRLALAAADPLVSSQYEDTNRRLLVKTLGLLDQITLNWRHAPVPNIDTETASAGEGSANRYGTADAVRYATESEDTAFVRNAVWDIQSRLTADKLNGRDPIITSRMLSELDAAIARAENPNFRIVRAIDFSRTANIEWPEHKPFVWDRSHDMTANANSDEWRNWHAEMAPPVIPEGVHYNNQVAQNTTTETTTTTSEERAGTSNLPQTGGDPNLLYLLGSSFVGLGAFLRRRRS